MSLTKAHERGDGNEDVGNQLAPDDAPFGGAHGSRGKHELALGDDDGVCPGDSNHAGNAENRQCEGDVAQVRREHRGQCDEQHQRRNGQQRVGQDSDHGVDLATEIAGHDADGATDDHADQHGADGDSQGGASTEQGAGEQVDELTLRGYLQGKAWSADNPSREFFFEIQQIRRCATDPEPERYRYVLDGVPELETDRMQWRVRLLAQYGRRSRAGQDTTVPGALYPLPDAAVIS
mgnify:CR=1 FL=1